jgi:Flp pilus assembly pilin Flp
MSAFISERLLSAREWVVAQLRKERGAAATEYVLLILGVVLFMIVAAFGLRNVLNNAVAAIGNWINSVNPPVVP